MKNELQESDLISAISLSTRRWRRSGNGSGKSLQRARMIIPRGQSLDVGNLEWIRILDRFTCKAYLYQYPYLTPMPALRKIAVVINHSKKGAVQVAELEKVCLSHSVKSKKPINFHWKMNFCRVVMPALPLAGTEPCCI